MAVNYKLYPREDLNTIIELVERTHRLYGNDVAYVYRKKKDKYEKTFNDLVRDSKNFAQMLLRKNLKEGHVAIIGTSSYEFIVSYIGTMYAGLVFVPLDKELHIDGVMEQLEKADVDFFLYDKTYSDYGEEVAAKYGDKIGTWCIDDTVVNEGEDLPFPEIDPDRLSTIIFTSGTTGKGKGVMLTQRNIARNTCNALTNVAFDRDTDSLMSVLPMNHAYECLGIFCALYAGARVYISRGLRFIQKELAEYQPTIMFVVPLIPQKLIEKVWTTAKSTGKEKKLKTGIRICNFFKKFGIDLTDKILGEVKSAFGGKLRLMIAGGAPVTAELLKSCDDIGINVLQGYGLSECSPLLTVNFDKYSRANSVGRVIKDCEVKIEDGEILARGISVSAGYYNDPENTDENFKDGWFLTGDLGRMDKDGFLYITGRKKNLIILGNGKNVAPEEIEELIEKNLPYITEVVVSGKDDKLCAEFYIDPETGTVDPKQVNADIAKLNSKMPQYKNIAYITYRDEPFPRTSTKKIIRHKK